MKIKLIRSTVAGGKRVSLKTNEKTGELVPQVIDVSDKEGRFLISIKKAEPVEKASKKADESDKK